MKRLVAILLAVLVGTTGTTALAAAEWSFAVSVIELESDHALLVNRDHLLEESDMPDDLVRAAVKCASSSKIDLREETAEALKKMFDDALLVT